MKEARKKQPSPFETMSIDELAEHYAKDPDMMYSELCNSSLP